ncbi:MAG: GNAT family N-acetyltransferase [Clostridiales bacterium]|nr:GNAT family N-acetyltransferase [Clostridiales bacterium]
MKLIPASDFESVKALYLDVIENTPDIGKHARWSYGKHPTDESLRAHIANGELYLFADGEKAAGMIVILMYQGADYEAVDWAQKLENDEAATLHLLAVCPEYQGKGLGFKMIEEAERLALENGKKAVRLDVLKCNVPSQHLYEKAGYVYRGEQNLYAENTGWIDFLFYEKLLVT